MLTVVASSQGPTWDQIGAVAAVLFGLFVIFAIAVNVLVEWNARKHPEAVSKPRRETLEDWLSELSKSMRRSAVLVEQVSAELDVRAALAKRLEQDAKDAEALAAVHKDQADAVRRMIDTGLVTQARRIRRDSIRIGIASFIAGGSLTLGVTLFVHPFH